MGEQDAEKRKRWEFWAKVLIPLVAVLAALSGSILGAWVAQRNLDETLDDRRTEVRTDRVQAAAGSAIDAIVRAREDARLSTFEISELGASDSTQDEIERYAEEWNERSASLALDMRAAIARLQLVMAAEVFDRNVGDLLVARTEREVGDPDVQSDWSEYVRHLQELENGVIAAFRESLGDQ